MSASKADGVSIVAHSGDFQRKKIMHLHTCFNQILAELTSTLAQIDEKSAQALIDSIMNAERIFVAGSGRSGLIMRGFAMRLMHLEFEAHVVGYVTTPAIRAGDLLIIGSGSGATASLRTFAQTARVHGAHIALITAVDNAPLAEIAEQVLVISAPTPKANFVPDTPSVQPMASLFEQTMLVLLDALSLLIMNQLNQNDASAFLRHANLE